jgi:hypothetical protein
MIIKYLNESLEKGKELKNHNKKQLLDYQEYIPMYDIYSESIILVKNDDLFNKMKDYHYRFIDKRLFQWLKNKYEKLSKEKVLNIEDQEVLEKLKKGIKFLSNYDLSKLYNNSIETMYLYSPQIGLDITICKRKSFISFFSHLNPYYSKDELLNLGLNMNAIKPELFERNPKILFDGEKHYQICKLISNNDVNKELLLEHLKYIKDSNSKYLIQYYSLYGSYFMNKFLRNYMTVKNNVVKFNNEYNTKSKLVFDLTNKLWNTISQSPPLDNDYILYRFVNDDSYLKNIKPGSHFVETGFMSTTRDPFYSNNQDNDFGFVLMKIRLPKGKKGVALNIELFSHFKNEEEFILPPLTKLKLLSKNEKFDYYHIDKKFQKKITKKYEFEYVGNLSKPDLNFDNNIEKIIVDFMKVDLPGEKILDRIDYFIKNHTNEINEFQALVGDNKYNFNIHWFDSTGPYNKFYYLKTKLGFSLIIYGNNGKVLLKIEIGDVISVNYYLKFMDNQPKIISDDELIEFVSKLAYAFKINDCIIHTDYGTFTKFKKNYQEDIIYQSLDCFNYPNDFYIYLKTGEKRFKKINSIESKFNYFDLDILNKKKLKDIYSEKEIKDILNITKGKNFKNLSEFFIYIIENKFYLVKRLIKDLKKIYGINNNPFLFKYYYLDSNSYLYNKGLIKYIPIINKSEDNQLENKFIDIDEYQTLYRRGYRN